MEGVLNGYVTNPNPTPTLTPNPNRNPNSNPNQINEKIQKETTLEIDQITKCQFGRWKLVKTASSAPPPFSYPEPFLRAVRRGALAKSITGYHKKMVRKQCPVLELANQMPVRNMDLARAPRRAPVTARKKGSVYENAPPPNHLVPVFSCEKALNIKKM